MVRIITPQDVGREIVSAGRPVLVAFLKRGQYYKEQLDLMQRIEKRYKEQVSCFLYSETFLDAGMKLHFVSGTPTYLLFRDGWEMDRLIGRADDGALDGFLSRVLVRCG